MMSCPQTVDGIIGFILHALGNGAKTLFFSFSFFLVDFSYLLALTIDLHVY